MSNRQIHVTGQDMQRLRHVLGSAASARDQEHLATLWGELDRAVIVSVDDMPPDVIKMRTSVRVRDRQSGQMLGFKSFGNAAITLTGIELAHRIHKRQFSFGPGRQWRNQSLKQLWDRTLVSA